MLVSFSALLLNLFLVRFSCSPIPGPSPMLIDTCFFLAINPPARRSLIYHWRLNPPFPFLIPLLRLSLCTLYTAINTIQNQTFTFLQFVYWNQDWLSGHIVIILARRENRKKEMSGILSTETGESKPTARKRKVQF